MITRLSAFIYAHFRAESPYINSVGRQPYEDDAAIIKP